MEASSAYTITRVPKGAPIGAGVQLQALTVGNVEATSLVLDDTNLYWGDGNHGEIGAIPRKQEEDAAARKLIVSHGDVLVGISVDATNVYWGGSSADGGIQTCLKTGCPSSGPTVLAAPRASGAEDLHVDANAIYWSDGDAIMRLAK
jgi:hypothetical protein